MQSSHIATYQGVEASTAEPAQLVLLLFDGAARFLRQGQLALARGDSAGFARSASRAHAIIDELDGSLNPEVGGELVENLHGLYDFMLRHLAKAMGERSRSHLEQVLALLQPLREGFEGAAKAIRRERQ